MNKQAEIAVRAARLKGRIGRRMAFLMVRKANVPMRLYLLAQVLEAAGKIKQTNKQEGYLD